MRVPAALSRRQKPPSFVERVLGRRRARLLRRRLGLLALGGGVGLLAPTLKRVTVAAGGATAALVVVVVLLR